MIMFPVKNIPNILNVLYILITKHSCLHLGLFHFWRLFQICSSNNAPALTQQLQAAVQQLCCLLDHGSQVGTWARSHMTLTSFLLLLFRKSPTLLLQRTSPFVPSSAFNCISHVTEKWPHLPIWGSGESRVSFDCYLPYRERKYLLRL